LPRYAFGATPEIRPPEDCVRWLPAAIPATCVAWSELSGSKARLAYFHFGVRGAKARATITFALVRLFWPLGKPRGIR
jgi:hypothetical protein